MVNCAPERQLFLVCGKLHSFHVFAMLMCPQPPFVVWWLYICRIGLEVAPTTCMGFTLLAGFVPVEF